MTPDPNRPAEVSALTDALTANGKTRIPLREIWTLWTEAAPRLVGDPQQAAGLAAALADIAERGIIDLPKAAWDTSTTPPLPRSVTVPTARRGQRPRPWVRFPWCAPLGWVASLPSLSDGRFDDLVAINDWLVREQGNRPTIVPMRYRSVLLFGDEKHLEAIARTGLFGQGRLSFDLLACARYPPPLAAAIVGNGPDLLVVENSDTYWTAVDVLRSSDPHPIGVVAWGAGRAFPSQVTTLTVDVVGRGPVHGTVWYWGDMDPDGLAIATDAAAAASETGAPPVRPGHGLWAAMAESQVQSRGNIDWTTEIGRDWLGAPLWERLATVRSANGRVAQESVPAAHIAQWAMTVEATNPPS